MGDSAPSLNSSLSPLLQEVSAPRRCQEQPTEACTSAPRDPNPGLTIPPWAARFSYPQAASLPTLLIHCSDTESAGKENPGRDMRGPWLSLQKTNKGPECPYVELTWQESQGSLAEQYTDNPITLHFLNGLILELCQRRSV